MRRLSLSKINLHSIEKNSLFFGRYRYSVKFALAELGILRGLRIDKIDQLVRDRNRWRNEHRGLYSGHKDMITDKTVDDLKIVGKLLKPYEENIKFVISYDHGYVYTNDLSLLEKINQLDCVRNVYAQEVVEVCPPGTIALKNPRWSHRTYFRSVNLTDQQKSSLTEYLASRKELRLSPGLKYWMSNNQYWGNFTQNYFFFDHNNNGEVLFLNMVVARITGRTMQIVAK